MEVYEAIGREQCLDASEAARRIAAECAGGPFAGGLWVL